MKSRAATSLGTVAFMAGAVIFAALAGLFLSRVLGGTYSRDPVRPIVVAAKPISAGQPMRKEDLRTALWPEDAVPEGAFGSVEAALRASRVPLVPFVRGEAVLKSHLSQPNAGIGIAPLIEKNHRAMPIRTDDPVTLSKLIYPGARVDVISTIRETVGGKPVTSSHTVIQNAKVLAVGEDIDPLSSSRRDKNRSKSGGALGGGADNEGREARGIVTLLVTLDQAEALSLAGREGKLDVVLRGPGDDETVPTTGATTAAKPTAKELGSGAGEGQIRKLDDTPRRRPRNKRGGPLKIAPASGDSGGVKILRGTTP